MLANGSALAIVRSDHACSGQGGLRIVDSAEIAMAKPAS